METIYHVFKPDGTVETHTVDWPKEPGYHRIAEVVTPHLGGATLEHVAVLHNGKRADMFVDEVGALKGLPVNDKATAIYRANCMKQHPGTDPGSLERIYGVAVLFDRLIWS